METMSGGGDCVDGTPSHGDDYVHLYKLVVSFKDSLTKLFSDKGLAMESSRLADLQTVCVGTGPAPRPPVSQLSSNVLLVFQLIAELIHSTVVNKDKGSDRASQTDETSPAEDILSETAPVQVSVTLDPVLIKQEKKEDNCQENGPVLPPADIPEPTVACLPLRKSLRTSVLNRKHFALPTRQSRRSSKPSPSPPSSPQRVKSTTRSSNLTSKSHLKPTAKSPASPLPKSPPRTISKSPGRPIGARKRKQGTVKKKVPSPKVVIKTLLTKKVTSPKQDLKLSAGKKDVSPKTDLKLLTRKRDLSSKTDLKSPTRKRDLSSKTDLKSSTRKRDLSSKTDLKAPRKTRDVGVKDEEEEGSVEMKGEEGEEKPRVRQRSGFAINLYERTSEGKFRCKECGKVAKLQTNIRKHLRKHTGEKPYRCSKCPAAFAYPRSLKRHQLVHDGIRPFKCPECDKSFFDTTSLRTHGRVHTDDRPFVCQLCGNRFRQKEGLKGHMRSHTGDRPYVCERCGMAFSAKRSLTRHIRVHTGERPYSCDQCVACFADWTTLHNHKLVHRTSGTGEEGGEGEEKNGDVKDKTVSEHKPFQCQFCGIRYRQPLSLKRHLRLHSNNPIPKKPILKRAMKRRGDEGDLFNEEESTALHLQYRPYVCEICGEKFKHLRGYETHKNKHQSGALTLKKLSAKRVKIEREEISRQDIEQAATILASVAVNSSISHINVPHIPAMPVRIAVSNTGAVSGNISVCGDGVGYNVTVSDNIVSHLTADNTVNHSMTVSENIASDNMTASNNVHQMTSSGNIVNQVTTSDNIVHQVTSGNIVHQMTSSDNIAHQVTISDNIIHHNMTTPDNIAVSEHHISVPHNTTVSHAQETTSLAMSLLPPPPPPQPDSGTVTILEAAALSSMSQAGQQTNLQLGEGQTAVVSSRGDVIQYTASNVRQVIQYPDGTLSEVTTLLPHPQPSTIIQSPDLLDNVVTVVFDTTDGNVLLENQS